MARTGGPAGRRRHICERTDMAAIKASLRRDQDELNTWDFEAHAARGSGHEVRCQPGHPSQLYARICAFRPSAKRFLRMARNAVSALSWFGYTIFEHGLTATCAHVRRAHLAHIQTGTMVSHLKVICPLGCMVPAAESTLSQNGVSQEAEPRHAAAYCAHRTANRCLGSSSPDEELECRKPGLASTVRP